MSVDHIARALASASLAADGYTSVKRYGAIGDGVADDTAAIEAAIAASAYLTWPPGTYRVTRTITVTEPNTSWRGAGRASMLKMDHSARGYVTPLLDIAVTAVESEFRGIYFNHNADGVAQPSMTTGLVYAWLMGVVIQADDVLIDGCGALNAWDNGFGITVSAVTGDGSVGNPFGMVLVSYHPFRVTITNSYAEGCGCGLHHTYDTGKHGAGFNNLSGAKSKIENCTAYNCSTGIVNDFGAGASAIIANNVVQFANANQGWGMWIGSGCVVTGNTVSDCYSDGIVLDWAEGTIIADNYVHGNGGAGIVSDVSAVTIIGNKVEGNGLIAPGTRSGIEISTARGAHTEVLIVGNISRGAAQQYGLRAYGPNALSGRASGNILSGASGKWLIGSLGLDIDDDRVITNSVRTGGILMQPGAAGVPGVTTYKTDTGAARFQAGMSADGRYFQVHCYNNGIYSGTPLSIDVQTNSVFLAISNYPDNTAAAAAGVAAGALYRTGGDVKMRI